MDENENWCRYTEVINLRFPHCGIASLAQVSTMGLCPLLWQFDIWYENEVLKKHVTSKLEVLHLFRCSTHTHPPAGRWEIKVRTVKWKWREMKMRWKWKWDESYLTRTRRGERNAEGKREHQHKETWPTTGKPWKGKEKEKRRQTETEKTSGGGEGRTRLNQPTTANIRLPQHAQNPTYLKRGERRNTWNKGPMWN